MQRAFQQISRGVYGGSRPIWGAKHKPKARNNKSSSPILPSLICCLLEVVFSWQLAPQSMSNSAHEEVSHVSYWIKTKSVYAVYNLIKGDVYFTLSCLKVLTGTKNVLCQFNSYTDLCDGQKTLLNSSHMAFRLAERKAPTCLMVSLTSLSSWELFISFCKPLLSRCVQRYLK